jgi:hypothetical protein
MFDVWHLTLGRKSWIGHPEAEGKLSDAFLMQGIELSLLSCSTFDTILRRDMLPDFRTTFPPLPSIRHSAEGGCCISPMILEVSSQKMKSDQGSIAPGDFWF